MTVFQDIMGTGSQQKIKIWIPTPATAPKCIKGRGGIQHATHPI